MSMGDAKRSIKGFSAQEIGELMIKSWGGWIAGGCRGPQ